MYFKNLKAELARYGITILDLAELLEVSRGTAFGKMSGRTEWKLSEIEKVLAILYHKSGKTYSVEYLFEVNAEKKSKYIGENAHQKSPDTSQELSESTSTI